MPFVKLDCNILNSTLWFEKTCRDIFLTSLLMAVPYETIDELEQIEVRTLNKTGWKVPPGKYGIVQAAGIGILHKALIEDNELGLSALEALGNPEQDSRSREYEGRRMVRVNGGYIVLNYWKYREKDHTAALRQARHRAKIKGCHTVTPLRNGVTMRDVTYAEAEEEAEASSASASSLRAEAEEAKEVTAVTPLHPVPVQDQEQDKLTHITKEQLAILKAKFST